MPTQQIHTKKTMGVFGRFLQFDADLIGKRD